MSNFIKIAVIGSAGSGKTSLIRRFSRNEYGTAILQKCSRCEQMGDSGTNVITPPTPFCKLTFGKTNSYIHTAHKDIARYYRKERLTRCTCSRPRPELKTLAIGGSDRIIQLTHISITDVPELTSFPQDTLQEFDTEGARGITTSCAFVLVFDVTKRESFEHLKDMRKGIKSYMQKASEEAQRPLFTLRQGNHEEASFASSNKLSRKSWRRNRIRSTSGNCFYPPLVSSDDVSHSCCSVCSEGAYKQTDATIVVVGTKLDLQSSWRKEDEQPSWYKDAVSTIKKNWKHQYIACSAKYGHDVNKAFMAVVDRVLVARGRRKKTKASKC